LSNHVNILINAYKDGLNLSI